MAFKAWLERKLHHGPYIEADLRKISLQLENIEDDGYKQVIDKALERVHALNTLYGV